MVRLGFLFALVGVASAAPAPEPVNALNRRAAWPNTPFHVDGRYTKDASNNTVTFAGINWPGHGEVMIPEGLQYQSIETIVSKIKSTGMNAVRLTYAIQMIDEIYDNGRDVTLEKAFTQGLGDENGTIVMNQFMAKNTQFSPQSTRLQVYDAVAAELARQEIHILLDNHMSTGKWCCGADDGNAFWGDSDFNTTLWVRGLEYMANHGKNWKALTAMSLRNEPRQPSTTSPAYNNYNWDTWYKYVKQGANAINAANPDVLVFMSGLNYDTTMAPVVKGEVLTPGTSRFSFDDFPKWGRQKLVVELHNYETSQTSCDNLESNLYNNGFQALNDTSVTTFPVMLTEYGFNMVDNSYQSVYATCIAAYTPKQKVGFFIWVIAGSYYSRQGTQDFDESWGVLNHDWSDWRNPTYVKDQLIPQISATLKA
ncbi:uncharacterized protein PgNI_00665 [Pyricularia grisea]|uniref:Glycoside hydrolase family 5 domain-containing protein n=1 Tax=Pyricularia grisea TaxID=148305 RepID=A0A6P8BIJ9_PYRGI|nr:uncharacterized protein PgNI_00665 [Pyricularia grisea]TLD16540.1 hypothetical protein PgNI_00665 [Pyricularia grisea]